MPTLNQILSSLFKLKKFFTSGYKKHRICPECEKTLKKGESYLASHGKSGYLEKALKTIVQSELPLNNYNCTSKCLGKQMCYVLCIYNVKEQTCSHDMHDRIVSLQTYTGCNTGICYKSLHHQCPPVCLCSSSGLVLSSITSPISLSCSILHLSPMATNINPVETPHPHSNQFVSLSFSKCMHPRRSPTVLSLRRRNHLVCCSVVYVVLC